MHIDADDNIVHSTRALRSAAGALLLGLVAGCGGGGGGGTPAAAPAAAPAPAPTFDPAGPSASFAQQCAAGNSLAASALRTSTLATEKKWLRAYMDEAYLWRAEVPRVDPGLASYSGSDAYAALDAYFEALKTPQVTEGGERRDRFSFTYPTEQWKALTEQAVEPGYGVEWKVTNAQPPRQIQVAYVEPGSPAALAGLVRGDQLVSADGTSADVASQAGIDVLNGALVPPAAGEKHDFVFTRADGTTLSRSLESAGVIRTPVPLARVVSTPQGRSAGYLLFNDHLPAAEAQLIAAVRDFKAQGVGELVIDLRYNGGGYLYIASELASMVAGTARTAGKPFETLKYSALRSAENRSMPFYDTSCILVGDSCAEEKPLPMLNLSRVYVLAQSGTCSASEAIVNSLRGVGVEVILVGGKTCGKPYGFTPKDNCGISYFPIEFKGVNAQGFGDYGDGFEPSASDKAGTRFVKGCTVADDTRHGLGEASEGMLSAALGHIDSGSCSAGSVPTQARPQAQATHRGEGMSLALRRHPARSNRVLLPR